jgi:lysophospholipase L1-like esterase
VGAVRECPATNTYADVKVAIWEYNVDTNPIDYSRLDGMIPNYKNLLLICISSAFALLSVEIGLRVFAPNTLPDHGRGLILKASSADHLQYELTPLSSGHAWGTDVAISSAGLRDREFSVSKTGNFRIAVLGDSITFGNFLPVQSVFPKQLENFLNHGGSGFEVLNFGVGGYDVINYLGALKAHVLMYQPDLVIIGYCVNDIGVASPNREYIEALGKKSPLRTFRLFNLIDRALTTKRIQSWQEQINIDETFARINKNSILPVKYDMQLVSKMAELKRRLQSGQRGRGSIGDYLLTWYTSEPHVGTLEYSFSQMRALIEPRHLELVVIPIPYLSEENEECWRIAYDIVAHEARKFGFDVISVYEEFKKAGFDHLLISRRDMLHPNQIGHKIIAEKIASYVTKMKFGTMSLDEERVNSR